MTQLEENLHTIIATLKTERDVLEVKIHLAKADVKDEWLELEKKWEHLNLRREKLKKEIHETSEEVGDDLRELGKDLKEGYAKIRHLLQ